MIHCVRILENSFMQVDRSTEEMLKQIKIDRKLCKIIIITKYGSNTNLYLTLLPEGSATPNRRCSGNLISIYYL